MSRKICVLGAGKAGEALIAGLLSSGWREPPEIVATARHPERLSELGERYGIETTLSNAEAVKDASLVIIAVKPQDIESLLGEIGEVVTTTLIERHLGDGVPVVRAMPNTPVTVHEGMAGLTGGVHAEEEHLALAEEVLGSVGRSVRVEEPYMDAVTAVSGSGPAYFALLAESMIEAGILLGLSREVSTDLVVQTMLGTAKLLRDEKMHPVELREMVTSPGGTTISAIRELEQAGVRAAFLNAIQRVHRRATDAYLEMEVRSGRLACCAHVSEARAHADPLPQVDPDAREVRVHRPHAVTVRERDEVAVAAGVPAGVDDPPGRRRVHRRAVRGGEVDSRMKAVPTRAEGVAEARVHGAKERDGRVGWRPPQGGICGRAGDAVRVDVRPMLEAPESRTGTRPEAAVEVP